MRSGGSFATSLESQKKLAYKHFKKPPSVINPSFAQNRQDAIYYGGRMGFEKPINRVG
jgi:hypothetical protein